MPVLAPEEYEKNPLYLRPGESKETYDARSKEYFAKNPTEEPTPEPKKVVRYTENSPYYPKEDAVKSKAKTYYEGLDTTAPTPEEEASIKEKARMEMQSYIDTIDTMYSDLITKAEKEGGESLKTAMGRANIAYTRRGTLDSPIGQSALLQTEDYVKGQTSERVKALQNEKALKIQAILGKVDERAFQTIEAKKAEAKGNIEKYLDYLKDIKVEAQDDAKALAKSGITLERLKANGEYYDQLKIESGFGDDDFAFDLWFDSQQPEPTILDTKFLSTSDGKTKAITIRRGLDGKITSEEQVLEFALPSEGLDYKTQFAPDGTLLLVPGKFDPSKPIGEQIIPYGNFAKPEKPTSQEIDDARETSDWTMARQFLTDNPDAEYQTLYATIQEKTKLSDAEIKSLLKEQKKFEGGTFLSRDWLLETYGKEALMNSDAFKPYKKFFSSRDKELDKFLDDLVKAIEARRSTGMSDKEILEEML